MEAVQTVRQSNGGWKELTITHIPTQTLEHPPNSGKSHRFKEFTSVLINISTEQKFTCLRILGRKKNVDFMGNSKASFYKSVFSQI